MNAPCFGLPVTGVGVDNQHEVVSIRKAAWYQITIHVLVVTNTHYR